MPSAAPDDRGASSGSVAAGSGAGGSGTGSTQNQASLRHAAVVDHGDGYGMEHRDPAAGEGQAQVDGEAPEALGEALGEALPGAGAGAGGGGASNSGDSDRSVSPALTS